MKKSQLIIVSVLLCSLTTERVGAQDMVVMDRRVPDEVMTTGGLALGLGYGGTALVTDLSAVRMNPANLALQRQYTMSGVYHWPSFGRPYYQAGILDSQTAGFAAGVSYTGFADQFAYDPRLIKRDVMLHRRVALALASVVGRIAVGANFQHVSGYRIDEEESLEPVPVKGLSMGLGVGGMITPRWRFGVSGENINNRQIEHLAPRVIRAGIAYFVMRDLITVHADYYHRQRLANGVEYNQALPQLWLSSDNPSDLAAVERWRQEEQKHARAEQMVSGSFSLQVYDMVRLLGAFGQSIGEQRQMVAGGVAMVNGPTTIAFTAARPYLSHKSSQQAFHVGFGMSM